MRRYSINPKAVRCNDLSFRCSSSIRIRKGNNMLEIKEARLSRSERVDNMVDCHVNKGMSTAQIALLLGLKKNSVLQALRYRGVLRKALGVDIEEKVAQWYERRGMVVKRQRGDNPFDLMISGERYDVKSAHKTVTDKYGNNAYKIQLQSRKTRKSDKDFSKHIDWFLFVFLDDDSSMCKIRSTDINVKYTLSVSDIKKTHLPLQFVGNLED